MDLGMTGKVALVTGGSRGIGKAIVRALAEDGCQVAIIARDEATCRATAAEIASATGQRVEAYLADTGDGAAVTATVAAVGAAFGRVDILVNSAAQPAGQSATPKLGEIGYDDFFAEMNVKVMGYLRVIQAVLPFMRGTAFGRIINISGLAARQTGSIIGSMRNISVAAMTKNIAEELAGTGITANCVHPGLTYTEKSENVFEWRARASGQTTEQIREHLSRWSLAHRIITSEEVASLVAFLASPRSSAVNGESIGAGGGAPGVIHY